MYNVQSEKENERENEINVVANIAYLLHINTTSWNEVSVAAIQCKK